MCYSAMVEADLRSLRRIIGGTIDPAAWREIYEARMTDRSIKIPRAFDFNFGAPQTPDEHTIAEAIKAYNDQQRTQLRDDLVAQTERLQAADARLANKVTKTAETDRRRASNNVEKIRRQLDDLERTEPAKFESRIFPQWFAPVAVQDGRWKVIRPMRYHCRQAGKPPSIDQDLPGLYNSFGTSLIHNYA
jgi:hypothetical protein